MPLPTDEEVARARREAVDLNLVAQDLESTARKARARANSAQARYDDLLKRRDYMTIDDLQEQA